MDGNKHEEIRGDTRISQECYVEIVKDSISNRNQVVTTEQYKKAVEFVKGGGAITAIESKYTVTPEQMKTLKNGVNG